MNHDQAREGRLLALRQAEVRGGAVTELDGAALGGRRSVGLERVPALELFLADGATHRVHGAGRSGRRRRRLRRNGGD